ncbi:RIB43A-like with coiled-coils protein 1 [Platysternon megacephalum]|uniref:RIB43A-like with coiled-coils protein 1 n=1 Tax=Platysternon megacephalum TaxID=55544 RepID=A0A4D9DS79_9SAUR|nr:RIB43A-like with coiled-coils protein 1 [Platysternon megacephalum]
MEEEEGNNKEQEQARSEDQDEPQEPALLDEIEGSRVAQEIRRSCVAKGGQCRLGICPWKETKIESCGFASPCSVDKTYLRSPVRQPWPEQSSKIDGKEEQRGEQLDKEAWEGGEEQSYTMVATDILYVLIPLPPNKL